VEGVFFKCPVTSGRRPVGPEAGGAGGRWGRMALLARALLPSFAAQLCWKRKAPQDNQSCGAHVSQSNQTGGSLSCPPPKCQTPRITTLYNSRFSAWNWRQRRAKVTRFESGISLHALGLSLDLAYSSTSRFESPTWQRPTIVLRMALILEGTAAAARCVLAPTA
jgi:hypothetical protein